MWILPETIRALRRLVDCPIANYSTDNPFNPVVATSNMTESLGLFDYYFTPRLHTIDRLTILGQKEVHFIPFGFDPGTHYPAEAGIAGDPIDVTFVGGADSDRVAQISYLVRALPGTSIRLFGGYWQRTSLRRLHGGSLDGPAYRRVAATSQICLNFGRAANEDGHSMKTFELPAMGACMLAESTDEHRMMLGTGPSTGLFAGLDDLVRQIQNILSNPSARALICARQRDRLAGPEQTYGQRLRQMLSIMGLRGRS
jgi:spore maturation protein CgeB